MSAEPLGDQEEEVEDDEGNVQQINVNPSQDAYDAVLVAAFGGVKIYLRGNDEMQVHPFYLFLLTLPLFSIQLSLIMFIEFDMSPLEPVRDFDSTNDLIFKSKLLIVCTLQLTLFNEMLQGVRLLFFMINPFCWTDVVRKNRKDGILNSPWVLAPFPIAASAMKLLVCYMTMTSSVSIILATRSVTDAIFDGLAITFIVDLDEYFWNIFAGLFHLQDFGEFAFEQDEKYMKSFQLQEAQPRQVCVGDGNDLSFRCLRFHSLKGFTSAHESEQACTFMAMFFLYVRQMCVVTFAIATNVLPVARDLCTFRRWLSGDADHFGTMAALFRFFLHHFLVVDPTELILHKGEGELGEDEDYCELSETDKDFKDVATEPKYNRMMTSNMIWIFQAYPGTAYTITIALFIVMVFPQFLHIVFQKLYRSPKALQKASTHAIPWMRQEEWDEKPMNMLEDELTVLKLLQKRLSKREVNKSIELCTKAMEKRKELGEARTKKRTLTLSGSPKRQISKEASISGSYMPVPTRSVEPEEEKTHMPAPTSLYESMGSR